MEAIELSMQNERNAHDIYKYLASANPKHRRLFKYLAITEMGHYQTLKQDFNFFTAEAKDDPSIGKVKLSQVYGLQFFSTQGFRK
jgi:hypothetical protein